MDRYDEHEQEELFMFIVSIFNEKYDENKQRRTKGRMKINKEELKEE